MGERQAIQRFVREEVLPFSADEVWRALTDPAHLASWLGDHVVADLRPGGELELRSRDGEETRSGFFEEVDESERRLTFWWGTPNEELTRVEIRVDAESPAVARLTVVETRPMSALDAGGSLIQTWATTPGPEMSASHLVTA
jgi:uncharacterized protein YndB with AHSA1/START domain